MFVCLSTVHVAANILTDTTDGLCNSEGSQLICVPTQHICTNFILSLWTFWLGSQTHSLVCCPLQGAPLGHTRCMWGYTHSSSGPRWWLGPITFPLENHSFWIPQMPAGCQGGGVGHDAVGSSSSCRGWRNLLSLHILPGSLARWLRDVATILLSIYTAGQNQIQYVMCTLLGSNHHPDDYSQNWGWGVPWVLNWRIKVVQLLGKEDRVSVKMTWPMITVSSFWVCESLNAL